MMNNITEELNEKLREACCMGNKESVYRCLAQGADINSKNKMNGWTCLHWASKRGHTSLVEILLRSNADSSVLNDKQQTAYDVADIDDVRDVLRNGGCSGQQNTFQPIVGDKELSSSHQEEESNKHFVPNYLRNPVFPYGKGRKENSENSSSAFTSNGTSATEKKGMSAFTSNNTSIIENKSSTTKLDEEEELVLKLRCPSLHETDFIEVEMNMNELTYDNLVEIGMREFGLDRVTKIRKLPDTIVRKDKDVKRLKQFQELEIIR